MHKHVLSQKGKRYLYINYSTVNNLEKTDPSEIESTCDKRKQ